MPEMYIHLTFKLFPLFYENFIYNIIFVTKPSSHYTRYAKPKVLVTSNVEPISATQL